MAAIAAVFTGSKVEGKPEKKSRKKSKEKKELRKAELLKGVPYKKADVEAIGNVDLRILGAALGINTFGIKKPDLIGQILKAQPKTKTTKKADKDKKDK